MWACLSVWAAGHSPAEPARAGALFQHRAPALTASQQDECRFGSQAGGNPRSLLWLRAPADLKPGFAVIPTSCCRSLISWSQPGKKKTKPTPQTVVVKAPHCQVVGRDGQQLSRAPGGRLEGLGEITVSLVGRDGRREKGMCFCRGSLQDPLMLFPCRVDGSGFEALFPPVLPPPAQLWTLPLQPSLGRLGNSPVVVELGFFPI